MRHAVLLATVLSATLGSPGALAQDQALPAAIAAQSEATSPPAQAQTVTIPAGTTILLELVEPLSSRTNQVGDLFSLRLRAPITIGDTVIVPAGANGGGEVIDASRSDMGGEQGKLILSARYLTIGEQRVRIRGLVLGRLGENRVDAAVAMTFVPYVGVIGSFIQGGEIDLPAGTVAQARLAVDVITPVIQVSAPDQVADPAQTSTTGESQQ